MKNTKLEITASYLKRRNRLWKKKAKAHAESFMQVFKVHHANTPFEMRMCKDNCMLFESDKEVVHEGHIRELLISLLAMGRFVHINIGTYGANDGSTFFYTKSKNTRKLLQKNPTIKNVWLEDGQKLINNFLNLKDEQIKNLKLENKQLTFL